MAATSKGIRYPVATDPFQPHIDVQKAAEDTDGALGLWLKMFGAGTALVGSAPLVSVGGFLFQAGSYVGTTGTSVPDFTMLFPVPFPNGVLAVLGNNGDVVSVTSGHQPNPIGASKTGLTWRWLDGSGSGMLGIGARVNWIAIGF